MLCVERGCRFTISAGGQAAAGRAAGEESGKKKKEKEESLECSCAQQAAGTARLRHSEPSKAAPYVCVCVCVCMYVGTAHTQEKGKIQTKTKERKKTKHLLRPRAPRSSPSSPSSLTCVFEEGLQGGAPAGGGVAPELSARLLQRRRDGRHGSDCHNTKESGGRGSHPSSVPGPLH